MEKRFLLAGLLIAAVLLSGCIKIEVREAMDAQGMSDVAVKMDMSDFPAQEGQPETNPCDSMQQDNNSSLTDVTCTYENKVMTIKGKLDRNGTGAISFQGDKIRLNVKKALEGYSRSAPSAGGQPTATDPQQLQALKAMGIVFDYYIKMPGTVTSQQGGTAQQDGSVKFDMLALKDGDFVESSTALLIFGLDPIVFGGAMAVIIVLLIIIIMLLRGRKPRPAAIQIPQQQQGTQPAQAQPMQQAPPSAPQGQPPWMNR